MCLYGLAQYDMVRKRQIDRVTFCRRRETYIGIRTLALLVCCRMDMDWTQTTLYNIFPYHGILVIHIHTYTVHVHPTHPHAHTRTYRICNKSEKYDCIYAFDKAVMQHTENEEESRRKKGETSPLSHMSIEHITCVRSGYLDIAAAKKREKTSHNLR